MTKPSVLVVMGSESDSAIMAETLKTLQSFDVEAVAKIISAHRTPERLREVANQAMADGIKIIIAGAGGAAHLPGMMASFSSLPVLGVPIPSKTLEGLDSLLSIVQMPKGIPVGSLAIGETGAVNAGLLAVAILALNDESLAKKLTEFRKNQTAEVAIAPKNHL
ncbi:MAG: 5-(carboxyamino)imidazole ribonucleotide mutase [Alphaproteobacteria bacterium]